MGQRDSTDSYDYSIESFGCITLPHQYNEGDEVGHVQIYLLAGEGEQYARPTAGRPRSVGRIAGDERKGRRRRGPSAWRGWLGR
jgi:hypothetical protein